jgi:hypothetical protein
MCGNLPTVYAMMKPKAARKTEFTGVQAKGVVQMQEPVETRLWLVAKDREKCEGDKDRHRPRVHVRN